MAQEEDYAAQAQLLLDDMSPEQRVGQIFLVTFFGDSAGSDSDIADLINNYYIGGVVLKGENDNITELNNTTLQLAFLNNSLQNQALFGSPETSPGGEEANQGEIGLDQASEQTPTPLIPTPQIQTIPVPLFIGIAHEGDGPPFSEILHGLTELPNQMAIGATWNPENSKQVGQIVGSELASLGFNLLLGPSLDVLETPQPYSLSDLGIRTYGGDPYWVGLMGQAYISGVHSGSNGRIGVIAKHFPGYGSSDRPINEEVGTVRKSLEQLKQIELAPFFAVTGDAPDELSTVDGLLTAHVRYQGFQGNIRATTAPVSFDPQALSTLLALPTFSEWHQNGGLIVSDELGVRAVQRFYDDTGQEFPQRLIAKDALLAGNDLLYLSNFALADSDVDTQLANIKDTIEWFTEKYETDQSFKQRVDDAALRVLQMKLRLYGGNFIPENILVDPNNLDEGLQQQQSIIFEIAQEGVTLIAPDITSLDEQLPIGLNDRIVIFTDVRETRQCSTCPAEAWIDELALERRMLALYGPSASEQIRPEQINSFSFDELLAFLTEPLIPPTPTSSAETTEQETEIPTPTISQGNGIPQPTPTITPGQLVAGNLETADWVIFALLRPEADNPSSTALNLFLEQRPDISRNAKVIVFAYNAPYFLDTTEISKLTAYFGVYSKIGSYIDASVRALFEESPLSGRSPVNIEGIRYDLFEITNPDPNQVIELFIIDEGTPKSPPSEEPLEAVPGATLRLQTGVIVDHNGNPVPDGTPVRFIQQDRIQGFINVIGEKPSVGGIANLDYLLEARSGNFRITASAGEAQASQSIDIVIGENAIVSINTPTPGPTQTTTPTQTPTITPTSTQTPTTIPTDTPEPSPTTDLTIVSDPISTSTLPQELQLLIGFGLGLLITGGTGYAISRNTTNQTIPTVSCILWGIVGGLLAYNYLALGLPGTAWLAPLATWGALLITLLGGVAGLLSYRIRH